MCNQKTRAVLYWSDIFADVVPAPVITCAMSFGGSSSFNSLIASAIPGTQNACEALACCSSGELWQFYCSPSGIQLNKVHQNIQSLSSHPKELVLVNLLGARDIRDQ
ncbi:hypothetical protein V6N13_045055 [Hibiscus sabdariffa]